jgi:hypothetical protein
MADFASLSVPAPAVLGLVVWAVKLASAAVLAQVIALGAWCALGTRRTVT